jgi:ribonuclease HI
MLDNNTIKKHNLIELLKRVSIGEAKRIEKFVVAERGRLAERGGEEEANKVIGYTDGSCYYKTRKGGLGIYLRSGEDRLFISQSISETTTGRVELLAMITALRTLRKDVKATLFSDSMYVVNLCNGWVKQWVEDRVVEFKKNSDLLLLLHLELIKFPRNFLSIQHVKGHSGVPGNEIADTLAGSGYRDEEGVIADDKFTLGLKR